MVSTNMLLASYNACTGCTACKAVCQKDAITVEPDFFGFMYPKVDVNKCISCGACEKVCPVLHPYERDVEPIASYAASLRDVELRRSCASGGLFTAIAELIMFDGGCVYGCVFHNLKAVHVKAETIDELASMRGSKYVQSDLRDTLRDVKLELSRSRKVLFSGTPCQIAAVNRFVGKDNPNLITLDLICHSVSSQRIFDKYKRYLERCGKSKLTGIQFRSKTPSWKRFNVKISYEDSRQDFLIFNRASVYCKLLFPLIPGGDVCGRASCHQCVHKQGASGADITIGDFWGIERVPEWNDDDSGTSAVVIHSEKGMQIFGRLNQIVRLPVDVSKISEVNVAYVQPCSSVRGLSIWQLLVMVAPMRYAYLVPKLCSCLYSVRRKLTLRRVASFVVRRVRRLMP